MIRERRGWPRAKRILSIEYRLFRNRRPQTNRSWHLSTTDNVSAEGLAFYSDHEYRKGDVLELRVVMSGVLDIFNGRGEVIRADQKRTGACFFVAVRFIGQTTYLRGRGGRRGFCVPARHRSPSTQAPQRPLKRV
ncbi:MAG: hypothetical protein HZA28_08450 [Candidatus Omnitrophica bacterium]|nr:hypothetical protein [Candidatus Omnitrophota bacterium]